MIALGYIVLGVLSLLLFITILNAITAPQLRKSPQPVAFPRVSVLVPARNEAENIGNCLSGLLAQDYPDVEIIVLDDHSTDETAEIAHRWQQRSPNLRLISGAPLPDGWLGKNWACHQLSEAASGDILIFADADTRHQPLAIRGTVGWMQRQQLGMLTAFLTQKTCTWAEKLAVPLIYLLVYSSLPLWLTRFSRSPSTVAANGQWIAFTRDAYEKLGGHTAVRSEIVEDMCLGRLAKSKHINQLAVSAASVIRCRMYHSADEVFQGFSKNLFGIVNYRMSGLVLLLGVLLFTGVLPFGLLFVPGVANFGIAAVALLLAIRIIAGWRFGISGGWGMLAHPLGVLLVCAIGIRSLWQYRNGGIRWKGRDIQSKPDAMLHEQIQ